MTATWHQLTVPEHSTTEEIPVTNPYRHAIRSERPRFPVRRLLAVLAALFAVLEVTLAVRDAAHHTGELVAVLPLLVAAYHVWRA